MQSQPRPADPTPGLTLAQLAEAKGLPVEFLPLRAWRDADRNIIDMGDGGDGHPCPDCGHSMVATRAGRYVCTYAPGHRRAGNQIIAVEDDYPASAGDVADDGAGVPTADRGSGAIR